MIPGKKIFPRKAKVERDRRTTEEMPLREEKYSAGNVSKKGEILEKGLEWKCVVRKIIITCVHEEAVPVVVEVKRDDATLERIVAVLDKGQASMEFNVNRKVRGFTRFKISSDGYVGEKAPMRNIFVTFVLQKAGIDK